MLRDRLLAIHILAKFPFLRQIQSARNLNMIKMVAVKRRVAFRRLLLQKKVAVVVCFTITFTLEKEGTEVQKKFWIKKIFQERQERSEYYILVRKLHVFDQGDFFLKNLSFCCRGSLHP